MYEYAQSVCSAPRYIKLEQVDAQLCNEIVYVNTYITSPLPHTTI